MKGGARLPPVVTSTQCTQCAASSFTVPEYGGRLDRGDDFFPTRNIRDLRAQYRWTSYERFIREVYTLCTQVFVFNKVSNFFLCECLDLRVVLIWKIKYVIPRSVKIFYYIFVIFYSIYLFRFIYIRLSKENIVTRVARMQRSRQFQGLSRMEKCNA